MNAIPHLLSGHSEKRGEHHPGVLSAVEAQRGHCGNRAGAAEQPGGWGGVWRKLLRGANSPALKAEEAGVRLDGGGTKVSERLNCQV